MKLAVSMEVHALLFHHSLDVKILNLSFEHISVSDERQSGVHPTSMAPE
jgi:hypothetical protein